MTSAVLSLDRFGFVVVVVFFFGGGGGFLFCCILVTFSPIYSASLNFRSRVTGAFSSLGDCTGNSRGRG